MIMVQPQQEEKQFKKRFIHLKSYISRIRQQIQPYQQQSYKITKQFGTLSFGGNHIINNSHTTKYINLIKQKQMLQQQLTHKLKLNQIVKTQHKQIIDHKKVLPCFIKIYASRVKILDDFSKIKFLLTQSDMQNYKVYRKKLELMCINQNNFSVIVINFLNIIHSTIDRYDNLIKFYVKNLSKYFILRFDTNNQAQNWISFLKNITQIQPYTKQQKWKFTKIYNKQQKNQTIDNEIEKKLVKPKYKIQNNNNIVLNNLTKQFKLKNQQQDKNQNNFKKKGWVKDNVSNSSFFLSNSSQKNKNQNQNQKEVVRLVEQQEQIIMKSLNFSSLIKSPKSIIINVPQIQPPIQKTIQPLSPGQIRVPKTVQNIQMPYNLIWKFEEKKKLLSEISEKKLGIHWYQDPNTSSFKPQSQIQFQQSSPQKNQRSSKQTKPLQNKKSFSSKKNQASTRRDSNESPLRRIKRVQSATRQKSFSRQSDSNIELQKGRTDYSLQLQKVESSKKYIKTQIRDHYLQRLMQKQAIRQISKSSSSIKQQSNLLAPIPQRKRASSKYSTVKILLQHSFQQQSISQQQKQSTQQQIKVQQLKNGIVLQKCSKQAWSIKLKKLYISNAMTQICYSDVQNPHEQKKYLIRDIKSIQYGRVTKGILKHKKKRCDEGRCLLIKIDNDGKQKLLQFYLEQSQPIQNLLDFAKKLHSFVQRQNQQQQ